MENQYHSTAYLPMASQHQQHYQPYNAGIAQQQQHQQQHQHQQPPSSSSENPTLPPLQPSSNNYSHLPSIYSNSQHAGSPHTPHAPSASSASSAPSQNPYSHLSNSASSGSMPPPSSYVPMNSNYTSSQPGHHSSSIPTSSSMTSSMPPSRLPDIRPAPPANYSSGFPQFGASNGMGQGQYVPTQEQEPTHVVGSQGRRGILPSAPGRAAPPTPGAAASTKSMIPAKDADGKFPCPHCNKTYLHAKHLKRHLLRHTGDRPYMCHLCKDTFSRSDILKRHFQKCSIRRGNPTGANHLAHQRRNTNPSNRLSIGGGEPIGLAGLANVAGGPAYTNGEMVNQSSSSPTVNGDQSSYASSVASISNRSSRANSLMGPAGMHPDARQHSITGLGIPNLTNHNGAEQVQSSTAPYGSGIPAYMRLHSASNPVPPTYGYGSAIPNGMYSTMKAEDQHNGNYAPQPGQVHANWSMFNTGGQENFMSQQQHEQQHMPVKGEHGVENQNYQSGEGHNDSFLGGMYSHPAAYGDDAEHHQAMPLATR